MGKSSSKHKKEEPEVKRRKKKGGKEAKARPVSDPGAGAHLDFPNNFSTLPKPEEGPGGKADLTGKRPYTVQQSTEEREPGISSIEESNSRNDDQEKIKKQREATEDEKRQYERALDDVLLIWPEYDPIRDIDTTNFSRPAVDTVKKIFKRLYEQYHLIQGISREKQSVNQTVTKLEDEIALKEQREEQLRFNVMNLEEDLAFLKGELRKRGLNPKLPERHGSNDLARVMSDPNIPLGRGRVSESSTEEDDRYDKLQQKAKDGIYQATPMAKAFADANKMKAAVKRTPSQLKNNRGDVIMRQPRDVQRSASKRKSGTEAGPTQIEAELDDMRMKVKELEAELAKQKEENRKIKDRIEEEKDTFPSDSENTYSSMSLPRLPHGLHQSDIVEEFASLENEALSRVLPALDRHLVSVNKDRRAMFVCAIMETAYSTAKKSVQHFEDTLKSLLQNPTTTSLAGVSRNQSYLGQKYKSRDPPGHMSKLAKRTHAVAEYPENITKNILSYLEHVSKSTNLHPLQERLTDELQVDYSECLPPSVLNQSAVRNFMENCSRVAWQMNLVIPPLYVSTEYYTRFDDRYHVCYDGGDFSDSKVHYYKWPILLSHKHGDVLSRGLVTLK